MKTFYIIAPNPLHGRLEEIKCKCGCGKYHKRMIDYDVLSYPYTWGEIDGDEVIVYAGSYFIETSILQEGEAY